MSAETFHPLLPSQHPVLCVFSPPPPLWAPVPPQMDEYACRVALTSHPFSPAFNSPDCFPSCCLHLRFPAHFPLRPPPRSVTLPPSRTGALCLSFFVSSRSVCARACLVVFSLSPMETLPASASCSRGSAAANFVLAVTPAWRP